MPAEPAASLPEPTRRLIRLYYGFQIFFALLFWVPVYYEFQRRIGLSDGEIFGIQSIYYVVFCLLEIPTGYLADRWGRLESMRAGAWVLVASSLLPIFAPSYGGMLGHFVLLALARSFISGASSAYVYGHLAEQGRGDDFKVIEGRARSYGLVAKVLSWGSVGWLMQWHLTLPYWATAGAALAAAGFAHALPRPARTAPERGAAPLGLSPAFVALARHPMLTLVMVQGISVFVLGRIVQVGLFQPILADKGVPTTAHGPVMAAMALFEALGSGFPQKVRRYVSDLGAVFLLTLVTAGTLAVMALGEASLTIAALSLFALATGLSYPIQRQLLNDTIPDPRYRATLLSIESIVDRAASAWVATLLAAYVSTGRTGRFLNIAAAVTCAVMLVVFVVMRARPGGKPPPPATGAGS